MNLPNQITVFRILLIPVFMLFMLLPLEWGQVHFLWVDIDVAQLIGGLIFIFASLTDWVDGFLARKLNLVTNLGKFLDPLADKLLVSAALIVLVEMGVAPSWIVVIIISREFAITGLRLILAGTGEVVAANMLGKIKTWAQIVAISALLLNNQIFALWNIPFGMIELWVAMIFTIWSGFDYFKKNWSVFKDSK